MSRNRPVQKRRLKRAGAIMAIVDSDFDTMYEIVAIPWHGDDLNFVPRAFTQGARTFVRTVVARPRPSNNNPPATERICWQLGCCLGRYWMKVLDIGHFRAVNNT